MKCEACGCEDRWTLAPTEKGFVVCECGHEQEDNWMNAEDHFKQIELTRKALESHFTEDAIKELSNFIYNIQLYERKGGTKDLW